MKTIYSFIIALTIMIFGLQTGSGQSAKSDLSPVQLGVSQINITPEFPTLMSGYEARTTPFTGIHDSLYASAMFFKGEKVSLLIITADLIGYNRQFIVETQKIISSKLGIPVENIMITAAHNHGGPVTRAYESNVPESVDKYVKSLQEKFVQLAVKASQKTVPFRMGFGRGACYDNINRRAEFADDGIWLGRDSQKPCDHELDAVKFEDMDGNLLAVFINWPCHGTASGQENYKITGDWPGAAAWFIKKQNGNVVVAVTAGASGDINPIYGPGTDFKEIEAVGYHAAKAAWEALHKIPTWPVESLRSESSAITLPGKKQCKDQFPQTTYDPAPNVQVDFVTFRIGHLVLAGISGEVMNEIGTKIKSMSPYSETVVITHCNGSSGYICTDKAFDEGGYEVKVTHLMPGAEKPITEKLIQMIQKL